MTDYKFYEFKYDLNLQDELLQIYDFEYMTELTHEIRFRLSVLKDYETICYMCRCKVYEDLLTTLNGCIVNQRHIDTSNDVYKPIKIAYIDLDCTDYSVNGYDDIYVLVYLNLIVRCG